MASYEEAVAAQVAGLVACRSLDHDARVPDLFEVSDEPESNPD